MRHTDASLVVIRFRIGHTTHQLFRRNQKWNDWSLVGGHMEPGEEGMWAKTAAREVEEEMPGLLHQKDFILVPILPATVSWGPDISKSANLPTTYTIQYFTMRFMDHPVKLLSNLPIGEFKLFPEYRVGFNEASTGKPIKVLRETLGGNFSDVKLSWDDNMPEETGRLWA